MRQKTDTSSVHTTATQKKCAKMETISTLNEACATGLEHRHALQDSMQVLAELWLTSVRPRIKESTAAVYTGIVSRYIIPEFGVVSAETMTYSQIESVCNRLLLYGGVHQAGLSAKTVADIYGVLKNILRFAQRRGVAVKSEVFFNKVSAPQIAGVQQTGAGSAISISDQTLYTHKFWYSDMSVYRPSDRGNLCA